MPKSRSSSPREQHGQPPRAQIAHWASNTQRRSAPWSDISYTDNARAPIHPPPAKRYKPDPALGQYQYSIPNVGAVHHSQQAYSHEISGGLPFQHIPQGYYTTGIAQQVPGVAAAHLQQAPMNYQSLRATKRRPSATGGAVAPPALASRSPGSFTPGEFQQPRKVKRRSKSNTRSPATPGSTSASMRASPAERAARKANVKPPKQLPPPHPTPGWFPSFPASAFRNTPSMRRGMTALEERVERGEGIRFLTRAGRQMRLPMDAIAHAASYFHTFYMKHSFLEFRRQQIAAGALYLASKTCECRKRAKEVMAACYFAEHHRDPPNPHQGGFDTQKQHDQLVNEVMNTELILLQSIDFALRIDTAYKYLPIMFRFLGEKYHIDELRVRHYARWAWRFILAAYELVLMLTSTPQQIAVACAELAIRFENCRMEKQREREPRLDPYNPTEWYMELKGFDTPPNVINMIIQEVAVSLTMEDKQVLGPNGAFEREIRRFLSSPRCPKR